MDEYEKYRDLNSKQKEDFARIANKLLSVGFLTKKKEDNKKDYYFVENHRDVFENYFKIGGWELEIDDTNGVFHLINSLNMNRHRFKLNESIILLILRLIYHEKMQQLSLAENVVATVDEIHERYGALKLQNRPIDKKTLKEAISLYKRFNLVEALDNDITQGYARIVIYPTILFAVKVDDIRKVYDKVKGYQAGEEDEDEEADQN